MIQIEEKNQIIKHSFFKKLKNHTKQLTQFRLIIDKVSVSDDGDTLNVVTLPATDGMYDQIMAFDTKDYLKDRLTIGSADVPAGVGGEVEGDYD